MARHPKICFDRTLPRDLNRPQRIMRGPEGHPDRAIIVLRKMWINGTTLRVRFMEGTPAQQKVVTDHAPQWSDHANLKFVFTDDPDADIRITFDASDGAWSWVGTDSKEIPQSQATMNLGWQEKGVVLHEFGHAIGLGHEHQNPRGGIDWNRDTVIRDLSGPPNDWTVAQIEHNVLNKYRADQINGTEFDRKSIMLYAFPGTWVQSGVGTDENHDLSDMDESFIASIKAYPRDRSVDPVELPVIDSTGTQADIGEPGEEDLFKFAAVTPGRYTIETGGQSDVVMKLFGPDNRTSLIAEDDDGGRGLNSKIVNDLMPGEYYVQIRHYNQSRGTGAYSIRVSK